MSDRIPEDKPPEKDIDSIIQMFGQPIEHTRMTGLMSKLRDEAKRIEQARDQGQPT